MSLVIVSFFFFFNDTATTEIYTLSLHDALPIYQRQGVDHVAIRLGALEVDRREVAAAAHFVDERGSVPSPRTKDRKSTRLNSSHSQISYAVFCLKKKKKSITSRY